MEVRKRMSVFFVLLLYIQLSYSQQVLEDCTYTDTQTGLIYDLTPLSTYSADNSLNFTNGDSSYFISICQQVQPQFCSLMQSPTAVCQYTSSSTYYSCGQTLSQLFSSLGLKSKFEIL